MASLQIGPVSSTVGLARATIARRSTCRSCHRFSSSTFSSSSCAASRRAQPPPRVPGRRPFSQQSHRPKADSKVQDSKFRWYPIPVGLGVGFLGLVQFYKVYTREQEKQAEDDELERPKRRRRVRPDGPWYDTRVSSVSCVGSSVLTNVQAGPDHVYLAPEGHVAAMGQI
jgi:phosphatidylserine decarboxylase